MYKRIGCAEILVPQKKHPVEGDWREAGAIMLLNIFISCGLMVVSIAIHCVNLTEYNSRKKALISCGLVDLAAVLLLAGFILYWHLTAPTRALTTPNSDGIVLEWSMGASYLAYGLAVVLTISAAVGSMAAKPEPEDEGMAAALELQKPEVKYKMQKSGFSAPKY